MGLDSRTLTAVDFLGLADMKQVARVDLNKVGFSGIVYVCDLTASQQQEIFKTSGKSGKLRQFADQSFEVSLGDMPKNSTAKFLINCLVEGAEGVDLDSLFAEQADGDAEFADSILLSETKLKKMYGTWLKEFKNRNKVNEFINKLPNVMVNAIGERVKELSGLGQKATAVDEKKDN